MFDTHKTYLVPGSKSHYAAEQCDADFDAKLKKHLVENELKTFRA